MIYLVCLALLLIYIGNILFDKRMYDPESQIWDKIYVTSEVTKVAPDVVNYSNELMSSLQEGNQPSISKFFSEVQTGSAFDGILMNFRGADIQKKSIVRFNMHIPYKNLDDRNYDIQYLLKLVKDSKISWYALTIYFDKKNGVLTANKLEPTPITDDFLKYASFSLNSGILNYIMLFLALLLTAFNLWVLFVWYELNIPRKWLWLPLILLGISILPFNWGSGWFDSFSILIGLNLPGVKFIKGAAFSPWILVLYIPVGSFIFLSKNGLWPKKKSAESI
jgi:hypothetical protein